MMNSEGFIVLHRKFLEWEWWHDEKAVKLFLTLLFSANWKEGRFAGEVVERGSFITSISHLSESAQLSRGVVRRLLDKFEKTGEIVTKSTNKWTLITLVNYGVYQDQDFQTANKRQTNGKQTANKRQTNGNNRTREQGNKGTKKQVFIPPTRSEFRDYLLNDYIAKKYPDHRKSIDIFAIEDNFFDHYETVGWKVGRSKMVDWKAAARKCLKWEKNEALILRAQGKSTAQSMKFPDFFSEDFKRRNCQDASVWIAYKRHLIDLGWTQSHGPGGEVWRPPKKKTQ